ncbi:MAG: LON peptidase substrate-binding domain-containing protein [Actinomycetota bacterium]
MSDLLPLFPLGTVLFPGAPLPLHIFEERYRQLVRDLVDSSERRWFGVVAIQRGSEAGDEQPLLYDVGCIAVVRRIDAYADGRYDLETLGVSRFRIASLDTSRPYLSASVELLDENAGEGTETAAAAARVALSAYWKALCAVRGENGELTEPPADPHELSYLAAAVLRVDVAEKQALLECLTAAERISAATRLLRRETGLLTHLSAVQSGSELTAGPFSLN